MINFFKSNFSARSCSTTILKTKANRLVVLWLNLMCDVWQPAVWGLWCSL